MALQRYRVSDISSSQMDGAVRGDAKQVTAICLFLIFTHVLEQKQNLVERSLQFNMLCSPVSVPNFKTGSDLILVHVCSEVLATMSIGLTMVCSLHYHSPATATHCI